jgi:hypothetical protein
METQQSHKAGRMINIMGFLKRLRCFVFGHSAFMPPNMGGVKLITIHDNHGTPLLHVEMCARCLSLYWVPDQPLAKWMADANANQP